MVESYLDSKKISVVMPVFNKEQYVLKAIESVLSQHHTNFELLVVIDPSVDKSQNIVESIADHRLRIFYRDVPGPGGYAARNVGVKEAAGDYVAFLDADDRWLPNHLVEVTKILNSHHDIDAVVMGYISDLGKISSIKSEKVLNSRDMLNFMSKRDFIHTNSIVVKRNVILAAGLFPAGHCKQGGDADTWLRIILIGKRFFLSDIITSEYYSAIGGVVSNKDNMVIPHPVSKTVHSHLSNKSGEGIRHTSSMKKIANRKNLSWMLHRKIHARFSYRELLHLYWSSLDPRSILIVFSLLLPRQVVAKLHFLSRKKTKLLEAEQL